MRNWAHTRRNSNDFTVLGFWQRLGPKTINRHLTVWQFCISDAFQGNVSQGNRTRQCFPTSCNRNGANLPSILCMQNSAEFASQKSRLFHWITTSQLGIPYALVRGESLSYISIRIKGLVGASLKISRLWHVPYAFNVFVQFRHITLLCHPFFFPYLLSRFTAVYARKQKSIKNDEENDEALVNNICLHY